MYEKQSASPDGRIDPVENTARPRLRRVANPLQCGQMYENHYVFSSATFPWRNEFVRLEGQPGDLTVKALRESLKPWGLTREAQSLLILSWALLQDKQFLQHGVSVRVHGLKDVTDELVLSRPATAVGGAVGPSAGDGRGPVRATGAAAGQRGQLGRVGTGGFAARRRDGPQHAPGCRTRWRPTRRRWVWPRIHRVS
jgi:hypothetical protein